MEWVLRFGNKRFIYYNIDLWVISKCSDVNVVAFTHADIYRQQCGSMVRWAYKGALWNRILIEGTILRLRIQDEGGRWINKLCVEQSGHRFLIKCDDTFLQHFVCFATLGGYLFYPGQVASNNHTKIAFWFDLFNHLTFQCVTLLYWWSSCYWLNFSFGFIKREQLA